MAPPREGEEKTDDIRGRFLCIFMPYLCMSEVFILYNSFSVGEENSGRREIETRGQVYVGFRRWCEREGLFLY
jgi:hypothetical protein